jgi:hypothetical protein
MTQETPKAWLGLARDNQDKLRAIIGKEYHDQQEPDLDDWDTEYQLPDLDFEPQENGYD